MTIEERFRQEQLELLRRLRDGAAMAMTYIEGDLPMRYDPEGQCDFDCQNYLVNKTCHFALGDFEIYDRRKHVRAQLERNDNDILTR